MLNELKKLVLRLRAKSDRLSHSEEKASTDKLLDYYTRIMTKVIDAERCSIFIHDPEHDKVWLKAGTNVKEHEIEVPKDSSIAGKVISTGKPMVLSELDPKSDASKLIAEKTGFETRNILCVPIYSSTRDEITGAIQILNKNNSQSFSKDDMAEAIEIAEHLQDQVDSVFLGQEIFVLSDKIYTAVEKAISYTAGFIVLLIIIVAFMIFVGFAMKT